MTKASGSTGIRIARNLDQNSGFGELYWCSRRWCDCIRINVEFCTWIKVDSCTQISVNYCTWKNKHYYFFWSKNIRPSLIYQRNIMFKILKISFKSGKLIKRYLLLKRTSSIQDRYVQYPVSTNKLSKTFREFKWKLMTMMKFKCVLVINNILKAPVNKLEIHNFVLKDMNQ